MKKIICLIAVGVGVLVQSCNVATRKEALVLNNTIVSINDSLYLRGKAYGDLVGMSLRSKDFSKLKTAREQFEHFIDSGMNVVSRFKDVGGSKDLRARELDLLYIEKGMVSHDFASFERLSASSEQAEIDSLFELIRRDTRLEQDAMQHFMITQVGFARNNGFKLSKNPVAVSRPTK